MAFARKGTSTSMLSRVGSTVELAKGMSFVMNNLEEDQLPEDLQELEDRAVVCHIL